MSSARPASESAASPGEALERIVEASREVLETRAELLRLEIEAGARRSVRRGLRFGLWGALAAGCGGIAWLSGVGLAYQILAARSSSELALGALAVAHGGAAVALAALARREAEVMLR